MKICNPPYVRHNGIAVTEPPRLPRLSGTPPLAIDRLRYCVGVAPPGSARLETQSYSLTSDNTF